MFLRDKNNDSLNSSSKSDSSTCLSSDENDESKKYTDDENENYLSDIYLSSENSYSDSDKEVEDENKPIYEGSSLSLNQFCVLYSWVSNKAKLNIKSKELILKFIKRVCPPENILPNSVYKINKIHKVEKAHVEKVCHNCCGSLKDGLFCTNKDCISKINSKPNDLIKFDVAKQLSYVLEKQFKHVDNLNGNL